MTKAQEAIERLKAGNRRFVDDHRKSDSASPHLRSRLVEGQEPFAVVLGCSDSRVPPEVVFDQDLGDLFVIRVAGNVAARSQVGSVEFAASKFGVELVVVLGHTRCGAIEATLDEIGQAPGSGSPNLAVILEHIRPALGTLPDTHSCSDRDDLSRQAVRANIQASVETLTQDSEILAPLVEAGRLRVVGAEYDLETGKVEFLDGDAG